MALTPTKTWEYSVNNVISAGPDIGDRNERLWLLLKNLLTDTGGYSIVDEDGAATVVTSPWVVIASSNAVTADASDNWNAQSDIVGAAAGVAHSWIHLRQVDYFGAGDHLNLLLCVENNSNCTLGRVSYVRGATGFNNDGTTTNRPTVEATKTEIVLKDGTTTSGDIKTSDQMWGTDGTNAQAVLHYRISDDGQAGAWWLTVGGNTYSFFGWQRDEEGPATEHTNDFWVWAAAKDAVTDVCIWASEFNVTNPFWSLDNGDLVINGYVTIPVADASESLFTALNDTTDKMLAQMFLVSGTNNYGLLTDVWWGSDANSAGDQSPATPPVVRSQFGHMVVPWPSGINQVVS